MTALVGARRLGQAKTADRTLEIDQGAIVEDGNHDELMAQQGRYA
jgi:ATP-binding cassette subfamily C protein